MQTKTWCPWWDVQLAARSTDQGDKTSKSQVVPKSPSDTSRSEGVHKFKWDVHGEGPHKRPHSPAQPRESVVHQPVVCSDTVVPQSTNWCPLKDTRLPSSMPRPARAALFLVLHGTITRCVQLQMAPMISHCNRVRQLRRPAPQIL